MSETVILITVISSALLQPLINFLYNSRCTFIKCFCLECHRKLRDDDDDEDLNNNEINN
jgi:hypothetical protein